MTAGSGSPPRLGAPFGPPFGPPFTTHGAPSGGQRPPTPPTNNQPPNQEQFANNPFAKLLNAIDAVQTDLFIDSIGAPPFQFSQQGNFSIVIDFGLPTVEYLKVGAASGTHFASLTRGAENSQAVAHAAGAQVVQLATARALNALKLDAESIARLGQGVQVSAGSTVLLNRANIIDLVIDASGAQVTVNTPAAPVDGDLLILLLRGARISLATPPILASGSTATIGNVNNPGGSVSSVTISQLGPFAWQYNAALDIWLIVSGLVPVIVRQTFLASGSWTAPFTGTYFFDGEGGGGAGGSGANGVTGLGAQNGGGGGGASLPAHGVAFISVGSVLTVTVGAGGTGVAGASGNNGSTTSFGNTFLAAGGAGGEFGGTPTAGTGAGGGSNVAVNGPARIPPGNPSFFDAGYGGWGGSTAGPVGQSGTQGRGRQGFGHQQVYFGASLGVGGSGGVQGATNTNPGGCGGGGGGAGVGAIGASGADGANGRPGGAGSAAGTGANGSNGFSPASNTGAGGGGGGAGGNGAVAGGTGGTGGSGGSGHVTVSFVGFAAQLG